MKLSYDLHIHSALSPCGDNDMTPNNIVNMSIIKGLDVIAVTDHNTAMNVRSVMKVAEDNLLVIPGIEMTTAEEVHVVAYFPTIESAEEMSALVKQGLPPIKNQADIFGHQYYMDEEDNIIGEEEILLVTATSMDIYDVFLKVRELGGICVPAHIDRTSYSVLSNLGFMPPDLYVPTVEITKNSLEKYKKDYNGYNIITSSDAHYLENIHEREFFMEIDGKTAKDVLDFISKINGK